MVAEKLGCKLVLIFFSQKGSSRDFGRGGNGYGGVCCTSGFSLVLVGIAMLVLWFWYPVFHLLQVTYSRYFVVFRVLHWVRGGLGLF